MFVTLTFSSVYKACWTFVSFTQFTLVEAVVLCCVLAVMWYLMTLKEVAADSSFIVLSCIGGEAHDKDPAGPPGFKWWMQSLSLLRSEQ